MCIVPKKPTDLFMWFWSHENTIYYFCQQFLKAKNDFHSLTCFILTSVHTILPKSLMISMLLHGNVFILIDFSDMLTSLTHGH